MQSILRDCLHNIVSDTVLKVHREEKLKHMQSAAIVAQIAQEKAARDADTESSSLVDTYLPITTAGASATEDGKLLLHGNPFITTPDLLCPVCRLPRLQHPISGKNSQTPQLGIVYCAKEPYIDRNGCDIYGKSLILAKPTKNAKPDKDGKDAKSKAKLSPDGSESPSGSPQPKESDKPEATSIPTGKCPNCVRYMAYTRIAAHLDRCMLSERQSSKNARAKMNTSTPRDSRAGTPKPAATKKRKFEKGSDEEIEEKTPKKKKKPAPKKNGDATSKSKALNSNIQRVKGAEKRLPGQGDSDARDQAPSTKSKQKEVKQDVIKKEKPSNEDVEKGSRSPENESSREDGDQ